jgi:hypothetical protein
LRQFDIREEQGAPNCHNTERAFSELGSGKITRSDQVRLAPHGAQGDIGLLYGCMNLPKYCGKLRRAWGRSFFRPSTSRRPNPPGGKIIKRKMLRYYSELETLPAGRLVLSRDRRGRHRLFSKRHSDWGV